ncbi:MAG: cysteine desulfurase [Lachnospira sp.]|nr:cysteine desulfurase [Lachnospira sp.]
MIYMDNAATTRMKPQVLQEMMPYMTDKYGNPSGIYRLASESRKAVEDARAEIASLIGAKENEIFFTSGGTESDNWVLEYAQGLKNKKHIITSSIEHHAIINKCKSLKEQGTYVSYAGVNEDGIVKTEDIKKCISENTGLVSVMMVNNEIGTIQPVKEISSIAKEKGALFHTDAVAAFGHVKIDVNEAGIDYLSVSAHKFCGPKGVGFLYARDGKISPYHLGGAQESNLRAGTENVAGIVGMSVAARLAYRTMDIRNMQEKRISNYMIERILREIPYSRLNGNRNKRVSGNMNFSFQYVDGGSLIIMLDRQGICASAGSACASASKEPSHVLKAIGLPDDICNGSVRFTINEQITNNEADYCIKCLKNDIIKLRQLY